MKKWLIIFMALLLVGCADTPAPPPTPVVDTPKFQKGEAIALVQGELKKCMNKDHLEYVLLPKESWSQTYLGNGKWWVHFQYDGEEEFEHEIKEWGLLHMIDAKWEVFEDSQSVRTLEIALFELYGSHPDWGTIVETC